MTHPAPGHDRADRGSSGLSITALVIGVLALLTCWTIIGGVLLGLGAVIVGLIALTRVKQGRGQGRAMAVIGISAGGLGLLVAIGLIALGVTFLGSDPGQNLRECLERAGDDGRAQAGCERELQNQVNRR